MEQRRLFRLAVEAGTITFGHEPGQGWRVVMALRRGDEAWEECAREIYSHLTTVELIDVIERHLDAHL